MSSLCIHLFNVIFYRGQPDALKGDALNKAVRETAQEAVSAIFASDEKISAMEEAGRRIQGFGSTNYDMPRREEKKTMFDEMVGFGSNTIRQMSGLGSTGGSGYNSTNSGGTYRYDMLARYSKPECIFLLQIGFWGMFFVIAYANILQLHIWMLFLRIWPWSR